MTTKDHWDQEQGKPTWVDRLLEWAQHTATIAVGNS